MRSSFPVLLLAVLLARGISTAEVIPTASLAIDLKRDVPAPVASPLEQGTAANAKGHTLTADSRSFFLDGLPWVPIAGEIHYTRLPRAEWRDALLRMKAGGLNTVATYVFWIHHEEVQGQFDWSGQRSLREFLTLCRELGLYAIVRMGPWCHGEVRNGGFPDWVQNATGVKLRTTDPAFMKLAETLYRETARQMAGLLWKDGGPVLGIQVDNECDNPEYLLALKALARAAGVDVPLYTMTGWNRVRMPAAGLLPLFGAYSDGFWGGTLEDYRKFFVFSSIRDDGDMGAQMNNVRPGRSVNFEPFPYACAEIGPGMMSSYSRRIRIEPAHIGAMTLTKLGCGNNMPGYYMHQGGLNPDGKLTFLNEAKPNQLPVKDYDFQTALGACGQVREQYHQLRQQHLFLQDFGPALARMPVFFPERQPASLKDFSVLRWSVRSDGYAGFLFFCNRQPTVPLPDHEAVQFALNTKAGTLRVPRRPITVPSGSYGVLPFNLDCDGVSLEYATVQPLCRVRDDRGAAVYLFAALDGITPELAVREGGTVRVHTPKPGTSPAVRAAGSNGAEVIFAVLTPEDGRRLWRASFAGRERAILSGATVLSDGADLRLQAADVADLTLAMYPPAKFAWAGRAEGLFTRYVAGGLRQPDAIDVAANLTQPARPNAASGNHLDEAAWEDAAVYTLQIPVAAATRRVILDIHYTGDAARLYVGDKLINDHFFNGDPFPVALWRIPARDWPGIRLKVMPGSDALTARLPAGTQRKWADAKAAGTLDRITVTASEQIELRVTPP